MLFKQESVVSRPFGIMSCISNLQLLSYLKLSEKTTAVSSQVHGGITQEDIRREVRATMATARENSNFQAIGDPVRAYTVLFFDEVNTCEHQGYIKSLVVDNLLDGEPIPPELNLRFVCALNPYQKHTVAMIAKLEHAGLGYCVGAGQSKEAIGATPLRHLVYRVQPLPESMRNCELYFNR